MLRVNPTAFLLFKKSCDFNLPKQAYYHYTKLTSQDKNLLSALDYYKIISYIHAYKVDAPGQRSERCTKISLVESDLNRTHPSLGTSPTAKKIAQMLIDTYARQGLSDKVLSLFESFNIPLDPTKILISQVSNTTTPPTAEILDELTAASFKKYGTKNTRRLLMSIYADNSNEPALLAQFNRLKKTKGADSIAHKHLIRFYCEKGDVDTALSYLTHTNKWKAMSSVYVHPIRELARVGRYQDAIDLVDRLLAVDAHLNLDITFPYLQSLLKTLKLPSAITQLVRVHTEFGGFGDASIEKQASVEFSTACLSNPSSILESLVESGLQDSQNAYNILLKTLAIGGNFEGASVIEEEIIRKEWDVAVETLQSLAHSLVSYGKMGEAFSVLSMVKERGGGLAGFEGLFHGKDLGKFRELVDV